MIERDLSRDLIKYLTVFPVVVLVGPRKTGKTILVRNTRGWLTKQSLYMDLEFGYEISKLEEGQSFLRQYEDKCVILDEFRSVDGILATIHDLIDDSPAAGRFLLISSAFPPSLQETLKNFSHKTGFLYLPPLNRLETYIESDLDTHWLRGGFPDSFLASDGKESFNWRDNLLQTFIERDLVQLGLVVPGQVLRKFVKILASNNGNSWNASIVARSMGVTSPTVNRYLRFLESIFLVTLLQSYDTQGSKRLVRSPRVYISDSGILHCLLHIRTKEELRNHIMTGSSWEGYVIAQIQAVLGRKASYYYYETHQGAGVDLVLIRNNRPVISIDIQTNDEPEVSKGFKIAINDLQTDENYIITPSSAHYQLRRNIDVIDLDGFLRLIQSRILRRSAE